MSGFLGTQLPFSVFGQPGYAGNSDVLQPVDYRTSYLDGKATNDAPRDSDILWPRSSFLGRNYATNAPIWNAAPQYWEWNWFATGGHVPKKISGVTKDAGGALLGGVVVQLFNTATGLLVDTQTSDIAGNYTCGDPNAVACFAVGYEAGSPDVSGTTKNNLTGI